MSKLSVIMCVYISDDADALSTAIESILEQTVGCDLLIYQDGPVSDELRSVLSYYTINYNVKLFESKDNCGLAFGLNYLISYSLEQGYEFIARMDSDDISYPDRMNRQLVFLNNNKMVDVLGTSCREFGASFALKEKHLPVSHEKLVDFSIARCPFIHPSVMFRASVFEQGCRYPENTTLTEDMALWFQLLSEGVTFANLNEVLLDYRLNENTINRRKGVYKALSEIRIRIKYMINLKRVNARNILLIGSRIVFHLMPSLFLKFAYKNLR
ncbi:glycosyltransferase [Vibrio splendidus]|uniref:glycosyltransferase n=1 Tax=Vibrio splendidus TaxID=29497 RepID=UPI000D3CA0D9|nr:glycosyltransferase [Vibrio splendidus]CAK2711554.1 Glycosyl transferase [Vibrio crassostreae]PTO75722.1 glycosyl transferase [Vibrio splendidus]CAK3201760.1 Glycosyl transferase [Vibrio crassostreae]CAK3235257.1 Glycosyl transferase [Vibrio crassostreae]CAK3238966.1 Glycosyl transferase [Vibrio crassostreae]